MTPNQKRLLKALGGGGMTAYQMAHKLNHGYGITGVGVASRSAQLNGLVNAGLATKTKREPDGKFVYSIKENNDGLNM